MEKSAIDYDYIIEEGNREGYARWLLSIWDWGAEFGNSEFLASECELTFQLTTNERFHVTTSSAKTADSSTESDEEEKKRERRQSKKRAKSVDRSVDTPRSKGAGRRASCKLIR